MNMEKSSDSLALKLREAVWPLHQRVEQRSPLTPVAEGRASREEYTRALTTLYGFILPLEQGMEAFVDSQHNPLSLPEPLPSRAWKRSDLLRRDLGVLGVSEQRLDELPLCHLPRPASLEEVFAQLYLLEGSRLGGKVIAASLKRSLGLDQDSGCAYFSSNGQEVGPAWSRFKTALEICNTPQSGAKVIAAAIDCFATLEAWFMEADSV